MSHRQDHKSILDTSGPYRSIVDLLPVGVLILSTEGTILQINPSVMATLEGEAGDQLLHKPFLSFVVPDFRPALLSLFQEVVTGGNGALELQITGLRGTRRWIETLCVPFPLPEAGGLSLLAVCRDLTERMMREGRDRYFQKLEAISTLTSGIAHDFNNILTSIVGFANVLKLRLPPDDPLKQFPQRIIESTERAAALTKSMLAFGNKQLLHLETARLADAVRCAMESMTAELPAGVQMQFSDEMPPGTRVRIDQAQMEQALRHILRNAQDAMPEGGMISIRTALVELEDAFISLHGYGTTGTYAVAVFSDTGEGMTEQTKRRAFEPFYTTRETGNGLGLGLAVVYGTIKSHNGFVSIYSEPGVGTTVRVYLPAHDLLETGATGGRAVPSGQGESILLAEDDLHVRNILTSVLKQFGYEVSTTATGEDAVDLFRENPGRFDLVMLDAILPGISGADANDEIRRIRPGARTLLTSGHTPELLNKKGLTRPGVPFMPKPVSPGDLLRKIREVLEQ